MGNYTCAGALDPIVMPADEPPFGVNHLTVVPENHDRDEDGVARRESTAPGSDCRFR